MSAEHYIEFGLQPICNAPSELEKISAPLRAVEIALRRSQVLREMSQLVEARIPQPKSDGIRSLTGKDVTDARF